MSNLRFSALALVSLALAGPVTADVLYQSTPRASDPNGFVVSGGFGAADDFKLDADAIAIGGKLWTYEAAASSTVETLRYAFWRDADLSDPAATKPSEEPLPNLSGTATTLSRVPGDQVSIGGVQYTPYEYVFSFEETVPLLADVPYWLSFQFGDGASTGVADFLWSYSDDTSNPDAWGTTNIFAPKVDWLDVPTASTAFSLQGLTTLDSSLGSLSLPPDPKGTADALPVPAPLLLMLPAIVGLARLVRR